MSDRFANLPTEKDTKILARLPVKWDEKDIIYEKWYWDGITAESIIFLSEDIDGMNDEELEADVRSSPLVNEGSSITIKRVGEFTFVNFNFVT